MRLLVTKRRFYSCYVLYKRKYFRQHYVFNDLNPYIDLKLIQITFRCTASLNEVFFFPRGHSRQTLSQHKGNIKCFCYSRTVGHVTDQGRVKVPFAKSRLKKKQESRRAFGGVARGTLWLSQALVMRHVFRIHSTALVLIAFNRLPFSDNLSPPTFCAANNTEVVDLTA